MLKLLDLAVVLPVACLAIGMSQSASAPVIPLNVKTGLWQDHTTIAITGAMGIPPDMLAKLTPEQRARATAALGAMGKGHTTENTDKSCLTKEDLTQDPSKMLSTGTSEGETCHGEVITSSATDLELHTTCTGEADADMHIKIHAVDSEHVTGQGTGTVTAGGHTMQSQYTFDNHWLSASCPAHPDAGQR